VSLRQAVPFTVLHRSAAIAIGELGPLCAVIWRDDVTHERFDIQRLALDQVVRRHRPEAGFLCVIEADVKPPSEELRKASSEMLASHRGALCCMAGVIEGDGFRAALTRSVLLGITRLGLTRGSPQPRYFANVSQASRWLCDHLPLDPASLTSSIERLRAQPASAKP
jgi:hypothetical protein